MVFKKKMNEDKFLADMMGMPMPKAEQPKPEQLPKMEVAKMDLDRIEVPKPIKQPEAQPNLFTPEAPLDQQDPELDNKVAELQAQNEQDQIKEQDMQDRFRQQQMDVLQRSKESSMTTKRDTDVLLKLQQVKEREYALRRQSTEDAQKNQDQLQERLIAQRAESLRIAREELEFAEKTGLGMDQVRGRFNPQPPQPERRMEDYIPSPAYPRDPREVRRPMEESYENQQERELAKMYKQNLLQRQQQEMEDAVELRRVQNEIRRMELESKKREYAISNAKLDAQLKGYGIGANGDPQQQTKSSMDPTSLLMLMQNPQFKESFKNMDFTEIMKLSMLMGGGSGMGNSPMLTMMLLQGMQGNKQPTAAPEDQFVKLMGIVQTMQPKQDDNNKIYLELLKAQMDKTEQSLSGQNHKMDELRNEMVRTQLDQMRQASENSQKLMEKDMQHLQSTSKPPVDPIDNFFAMHEKLKKTSEILGGAVKEPGMVEKIGAIVQPLARELAPAIAEFAKGQSQVAMFKAQQDQKDREAQLYYAQMAQQQAQQNAQQEAIKRAPSPNSDTPRQDDSVKYGGNRSGFDYGKGGKRSIPRAGSSIPRDDAPEDDDNQPKQAPGP